MYCTYCNHPNAEGNKFCESCGRPLNPTPVPPPQPAKVTSVEPLKTKKVSNVRRLASIGGLVVIICFFLPWVLVSCSYNLGATNNVGYGLTGFELASGTYPIMNVPNNLQTNPFLSQKDNSTSTDSYPWLLVIPLMGLIGLTSLNGKVSGSILALVSGIIGVIGMLAFTIGVIYINSKISIAGFRYEYQSGFWGTWIGLIWQVILSMITYKNI